MVETDYNKIVATCSGTGTTALVDSEGTNGTGAVDPWDALGPWLTSTISFEELELAPLSVKIKPIDLGYLYSPRMRPRIKSPPKKFHRKTRIFIRDRQNNKRKKHLQNLAKKNKIIFAA